MYISVVMVTYQLIHQKVPLSFKIYLATKAVEKNRQQCTHSLTLIFTLTISGKKLFLDKPVST